MVPYQNIEKTNTKDHGQAVLFIMIVMRKLGKTHLFFLVDVGKEIWAIDWFVVLLVKTNISREPFCFIFQPASASYKSTFKCFINTFFFFKFCFFVQQSRICRWEVFC